MGSTSKVSCLCFPEHGLSWTQHRLCYPWSTRTAISRKPMIGTAQTHLSKYKPVTRCPATKTSKNLQLVPTLQNNKPSLIQISSRTERSKLRNNLIVRVPLNWLHIVWKSLFYFIYFFDEGNWKHFPCLLIFVDSKNKWWLFSRVEIVHNETKLYSIVQFYNDN